MSVRLLCGQIKGAISSFDGAGLGLFHKDQASDHRSSGTFSLTLVVAFCRPVHASCAGERMCRVLTRSAQMKHSFGRKSLENIDAMSSGSW